MANAVSRKSSGRNAKRGTPDSTPKSESGSHEEMPAAELLSFLKEVRGVQPWTEKDLANILKTGLPQAKEATAVLQLQGYIEPVDKGGKWRATEQGEIVSGAKPPRFTPERVADAIAGLRDRIKQANENPAAAYRITEAVAFGDFLRGAARLQAADVGVCLVPKSASGPIASAQEHAAELNFLKKLRGQTALLHVIPYEDWMSSRSHQRLL